MVEATLSPVQYCYICCAVTKPRLDVCEMLAQLECSTERFDLCKGHLHALHLYMTQVYDSYIESESTSIWVRMALYGKAPCMPSTKRSYSAA